VVNGALFARRMKGVPGTVGAACVGDGASSTGSFHEALNQAAVEKLPLVLILANNQYAYSTPTTRQFACRDLADKAVGYGVEVQSVDGTDLAACLKLSATLSPAPAPAAARNWSWAALLRLCGHGEHDDAGYIDPKLKALPLGRDCMKVARNICSAKNGRTPGRWPRCAARLFAKSRKPSPRSSVNPCPIRSPRTGARFQPGI